jgi:hypothetical protein
MKERHLLALSVLGAIFLVLIIFLVITLVQGDDTNRGAGMGVVQSR